MQIYYHLLGHDYKNYKLPYSKNIDNLETLSQ